MTDPATEVGIAPLADVPCLTELPTLIDLKYSTALNRWTNQSESVVRLHDVTHGQLARSLVWRDLLIEHGVTDIASIVFRDRSGCWAFLDLWRIGGVFTDTEARLLGGWTDAVTEALRRCVAHSFNESSDGTVERIGPVVLLLTPALQVRAQTPDTEHYLRTLIPPDDLRPPIPAAAYNVGAQLLAVERGVDPHPPRARVHLTGGGWVTVRAARIDDGIAVTIETSSPAERLDLFCRSANLTTRERELVEHLAAGADTAALTQHMFLSSHTVQDHLKSIFAKTGTHSRRELLTRAIGR